MRKIFLLALGLILTIGAQAQFASRAIYAAMWNDSTMYISYDFIGPNENEISNWNPNEGTVNMTDEELAAVKKVEIDYTMEDAPLTSLEAWFANLSNVTYITGLHYLNTTNVTSMASMCAGCSSLRYLNLGYFLTPNLQFTRDMFADCTSLETLDLRQFTLDNMEDMSYMFYNCSALKDIFSTKDWTNTLAETTDMFHGCTGHFCKPKDVYTYYNSNTHSLSYYYDDQMASRSGIYKELYDPMENPYEPRFLAYHEEVTHARIDPSMKDYPYNSMAYMFGGNFNGEIGWYGLDNMVILEGLEYLNTSRVENMERMFFECSALVSLDLSKFNTSSVTNMWEMFSSCNELTSVNLNSFDTRNVTNMGSMFSYCFKLRDLDLSSFNTEKVRDLSFMFDYCEMPELDLTSFKLTSAEDVGAMFRYSKINTIYCNDDWSQYPALAEQSLFWDCTSLVGGNGTVYSADHTDITYARPDQPGQPGYFTAQTQGIDDVQGNKVQGTKVIRDGQLFIEINGRTYDAQGKEVK